MANISMVLVDEHFLHGQVAELWCEEVQSQLIIIINDNLSTNKIQQGILDMVVPDEMICRYYSMDKAVNKLSEMDSKKNVLIIVDSLEDLERLIQVGVQIPRITIASVAASSSSKTIAPGVSLTNDQIEWLKSLRLDGVEVQIRQLPTDENIDL